MLKLFRTEAIYRGNSLKTLGIQNFGVGLMTVQSASLASSFVCSKAHGERFIKLGGFGKLDTIINTFGFSFTLFFPSFDNF